MANQENLKQVVESSAKEEGGSSEEEEKEENERHQVSNYISRFKSIALRFFWYFDSVAKILFCVIYKTCERIEFTEIVSFSGDFNTPLFRG
jgi:hypothetical protein